MTVAGGVANLQPFLGPAESTARLTFPARFMLLCTFPVHSPEKYKGGKRGQVFERWENNVS